MQSSHGTIGSMITMFSGLRVELTMYSCCTKSTKRCQFWAVARILAGFFCPMAGCNFHNSKVIEVNKITYREMEKMKMEQNTVHQHQEMTWHHKSSVTVKTSRWISNNLDSVPPHSSSTLRGIIIKIKTKRLELFHVMCHESKIQ